jgi:uncharacterized protein (DUF58 family)
VLITLVVAVAATNTGNNALYMVWSAMLGALVLSGLVSRQNVRRLAVELEAPPEVYANQPFELRFSVSNRSRLLARWFLLFSVARDDRPSLLPYLPPRGQGRGVVELIRPRRGRFALGAVHVSSLFPFGLFRKGARYAVPTELLVYPELFPAAARRPAEEGDLGSDSTRRRGRGQDLHALRRFRPGDDPRAIHWKQTARTGSLIYVERQTDESQRLSILFDNGVGELAEEEQTARFERLVSEAATAAVDYLSRRYYVELVARDVALPFAGGERQRLAILEALALIGPTARRREPLVGSVPRVPQLRLGFDGSTRLTEEPLPDRGRAVAGGATR